MKARAEQTGIIDSADICNSLSPAYRPGSFYAKKGGRARLPRDQEEERARAKVQTGITHRLFVAVPLPAEQKEFLFRWCAERKREWMFGKWVFREDYHLTLQFLGECTREQTGRIIAALTDLAKCQKPFALQIQGIGSFGRPEQPRILWAGVTGELDALHLLQRQVTERLSHIGFPPEDRPYRPHITLARKCQQTGFPSRDLAVFQPVEEAKAGWTVGEIVLYETRFGQTPMYHAVQHFPFGERVG